MKKVGEVFVSGGSGDGPSVGAIVGGLFFGFIVLLVLIGMFS